MTQTLEQLLETRYHAQGRGLHEKLSSVETQIPKRVQKRIRFIATMRNKATHEDVNIASERYSAIVQAYDEVMRSLHGSGTFWVILKRKLFVVAIAALAALIYYFFKLR